MMERRLCCIAGCTHEAEEAGMCCAHFTAALVHGALQYVTPGGRPMHN